MFFGSTLRLVNESGGNLPWPWAAAGIRTAAANTSRRRTQRIADPHGEGDEYCTRGGGGPLPELRPGNMKPRRHASGGGASCSGYARQDRVTVKVPQAVKAIVTLDVAPFFVTVAMNVPASNFGRTVQAAL